MAANGMGNTTNIPITIAGPILNNTQTQPHNVHNISSSNSVTGAEPKEQKTNDLLHAQVHKSSCIVAGQNDAADRASSSGRPVPSKSWADDDDDDMVDVMDDVNVDAAGTSIHAFSQKRAQTASKSHVPIPTSSAVITQPQTQPVFDRVFTAAHPMKTTKSTVPPFPARVIENDDAHLDMHGKPVLGSFDKTTILIRVDLRSLSSPFKGYGLSRSRSNNLTSFRRVLYKASELTKSAFNPSEMFVGMNKGNVKMDTQSNVQMDALKEMIKIRTTEAATAAAAAQNGTGSDLSPPNSSSVTSTSLSSSSPTPHP